MSFLLATQVDSTRDFSWPATEEWKLSICVAPRTERIVRRCHVRSCIVTGDRGDDELLLAVR
jgi:hypothetical protein